MIKFLSAIGLALILVGCQSTQSITVYKQSHIEIPANIRVCKELTKADFPKDPNALTNAQLHEFIARLVKFHGTCAANMKAVNSYISKYNLSVDLANSTK